MTPTSPSRQALQNLNGKLTPSLLEKTWWRGWSFGLLLGLMALATWSQAQETLRRTPGNPWLKQNHSLNLHSAAKNLASDTLDLPFLDDFSEGTGYPSAARWADNQAFVNTSGGFNPLSLGVATLDAIDFDGTMYETASSSAFLADALTSLPVNLGGYAPTDSVYLSFFFQAGGWADVPETSDSLVLEFYAPSTGQWVHQWSTPGEARQEFRITILPVTDTLFLKNGFKFRFRNYASLTGLFEPSWAGNCDHWHLDYVFLDQHRSPEDTVMTDLAFFQPTGSMLKNYEAMPWLHFLNDNSEQDYFIDFHFRNNDQVVRTHYLEFQFLEVGTTDTFTYPLGAFNQFPAFTDTSISFEQSHYFGSTATEKTAFKIRSFFRYTGASNDLVQTNDTVTYLQVFDNYYAYDDGTSENGYGLSGEGTQNGKVAILFHNYKTTDTLRAIQMYFNQTEGNASQDYFYLTIWSDKLVGGLHQPDTIIFRKIGFRPEYEDSLNQFHTYLLDTAMAMPEYFYVGWTQTTTDLLNLGFDVNRNSKPDTATNWKNPVLYYNTTGTWFQSTYSGAPMVRTVFSASPILSFDPLPQPADHVILWPNPANESLQFSIPSGFDPVGFQIVNISGQTVRTGNPADGHINLGGLPHGLFVLILNDSRGQTLRGKFLVAP